MFASVGPVRDSAGSLASQLILCKMSNVGGDFSLFDGRERFSGLPYVVEILYGGRMYLGS